MNLTTEQIANKLMGLPIDYINRSGASLLELVHSADSEKAHINLIWVHSDKCPICNSNKTE